MHDESDQDLAVKEQMKQWTYDIESVTSKSIKIKINLENPTVYDGEQYVSIKAKFSDFEPGWDDDRELRRIEIPKQKIATVSPATAAKVGAAADAT